MNTLDGLALALTLAFTIAASEGCATAPTTTSTTPDPTASSTAMSATPTEDPMVDPTLPSWAPRSCSAYHVAIVRFVSCTLGDAARRETAREAYDATTRRWHEMHDLPQGAIEDVRASCATETGRIRALTDPNCPQTTTTPPAA